MEYSVDTRHYALFSTWILLLLVVSDGLETVKVISTYNIAKVVQIRQCTHTKWASQLGIACGALFSTLTASVAFLLLKCNI